MKVGLFSSVHSLEILKDAKYDEKNNIELFNNFKPDIICGEVRPEDFKSLNVEDFSKYTSQEYKRYIFDYCKKYNIEFVPCDYFENSNILLNKSLQEMELTSEQKLLMDKSYLIGKQSKIPFNSEDFNELARKIHNLDKVLYPEINKIIWEDRNIEIVKNIIKVIEHNPNKNILIIFGAEHTYWIKDELEKLDNIELVFPL